MDPKNDAKACMWAKSMAHHLSFKKSPNQINRPIIVKEMVQNNLNIVFYAVLGHLGTPKCTQKGTQRPQSSLDVWSNV
jgi:hypothetical protein